MKCHWKVGVVCVALIVTGCKQTSDEADPAVVHEAKVDQRETCRFGVPSDRIVAVKSDTDLHSEPKQSGKRIVNERATEIMKETHYQQVDNTEKLKEHCRADGWSMIQVMEPDHLAHVVGWLPTARLRELSTDSSGKRTYVENDFYWDKDTRAFKKEIVANVNQIVRVNSRCSTVDPGSVALSSSRSAPGKPVFFVMCQNGNDVFNVWFEPHDAL